MRMRRDQCGFVAYCKAFSRYSQTTTVNHENLSRQVTTRLRFEMDTIFWRSPKTVITQKNTSGLVLDSISLSV
jgi:hypothetical protein